jgi:hypothetical protein
VFTVTSCGEESERNAPPERPFASKHAALLHCSYIFCAIAIKEIPTGILTFDSTRFKMGTMVSKEET